MLKNAPPDTVYKFRIFGREHVLYQFSHLNYGLKEAGKYIAELCPKAACRCLPKDFALDVHDGRVVSNREGTPQSFDTCRTYAKKFLNKDAECKQQCSFNGVFQPPLRTSFKNDIYAFSYFYDRMIPFLPEDGVVSVGEYKRVGTEICSGADKKYAEHNLGTECLDFAYLYELLVTGYDLPDTQKLHIKKKINGIETAWALGAMIVAMQ